MSRSITVRSLLLAASLAVAVPAGAQTPLPSDSVAALIDALFAPPAPYNPNRETLLSPNEFNRRHQDSREGIGIGLGTALASFPLGASSAGFAYTIDPATGAAQLKAVSFGGIFVDRAVTNGRGVLNLGVTYQHASFDVLQGLDLSEGGFPIQSQLGVYSVPYGGSRVLPEGFDVGDVWRAELELDSQTFVFSGSYGLSDRADLGWAIPVATVNVDGRLMRDYDAARDYNAFPAVPALYPNVSGTLVQSAGEVNATGLGDIIVRGKYGFGPAARQLGFVIGEVRLPTGDEDNLLGAGEAAFRLSGGATQRLGAAALNINAGYSFGGLTDEVNFAAGTEIALLARKQLTILGEVLTQTLRDTVTSVGNFTSFDETPPDLSNPLNRRVVVSYGFWNRGQTTLARAAIGAKYNIARSVLLTGTGVFRLNENGLQPKVAVLAGLEYTFVRR